MKTYSRQNDAATRAYELSYYMGSKQVTDNATNEHTRSIHDAHVQAWYIELQRRLGLL